MLPSKSYCISSAMKLLSIAIETSALAEYNVSLLVFLTTSLFIMF